MNVILQKPIKSVTNVFGKDTKFNQDFSTRVAYKNNEVDFRPFYDIPPTFSDSLPLTTSPHLKNSIGRPIPAYTRDSGICTYEKEIINDYWTFQPLPAFSPNVTLDPRFQMAFDYRKKTSVKSNTTN